MITKIAATAAISLSMLAATTAQASSAQALSLRNSPAVSRASSDAGSGNALAGGSAFGYVLAALVAGAAIWGVIEIVDDNSDESDSN